MGERAAGRESGGSPTTGRVAVVWPKDLGIFVRCPRQYDLVVRRKRRGPVLAQTAAQAEGNALHATMRRWFRLPAGHRAGLPPAAADDGALAGPAADLVGRWLEDELPAAPYLSTGGRDRALRSLAGQAGWCLGQVPTGATVLSSERQLQSPPVRVAPGLPPVRYQARLDLVVAHPDGAVEHVDFKTGPPRPEHWVQRAVERLLVATRHPVAPGAPPTRTTTLYATARQVDTERHTPETYAAARTDLRALTVRMLAGEDTAPTPAGHCHFCPHRPGCPAHPD